MRQAGNFEMGGFYMYGEIDRGKKNREIVSKLITCVASSFITRDLVNALPYTVGRKRALGAMQYIRYPFETPFKSKSRESSFAHNSLLNRAIVLKFCTEHRSDTAVLCAEFQNDWINENDVTDERDFTTFEFKIRFGRIYHIARDPWFVVVDLFRSHASLQ